MSQFGIACLVGLGGAIGALARYGASRAAAAKKKPGFYATLAVNLAGSFLMGLFIGCRLESGHAVLYAFAGTGILGGLTTYSTLNVQKASLLRSGAKRTLLYYVAATYAVGFGLTALGVAIGDMMLT
ncbi:fluoride efflux transporter FluC [Cohnella suwonensis]|uniref:Fluoride-specific ion channel FluC n=1 Tax=Cohnella suwonensis TaxID=696072 RepID=A0ABW0LPK9_9BACL